MSSSRRLENEVGSASRQSEQVTRSGAECKERLNGHDGGSSGSKTRLNAGGASHRVAPSSLGAVPSFIPSPYSDNVNYRTSPAALLLMMWDFLVHKVRIGTTNVVLNRKDDVRTMMIIPAKARSRYYSEGRLYMAWKIRKRLDKFDRVPGLMLTLTYDPKKINKKEAWESYGSDTRRFFNAINQSRKRVGQSRLHYFWVVEVQPGSGYPHVHIFFPRLRWVAPFEVIRSTWSHGRTNIKKPDTIKINCAAYISKYLRKMEGWSDFHLALLRAGKCRMYGFSRGFSVKPQEKEKEWQKWGVLHGDDTETVEQRLEKAGFIVEHGTRVSQGRAQARSQTETLTNPSPEQLNDERLAPLLLEKEKGSMEKGGDYAS